ncbi:MAG: hypothetical protein OXG24_00620 [Gammaproteobacteria bacterium]|nr:hypothetical protein [Gammaproteobacteria bacterium]
MQWQITQHAPTHSVPVFCSLLLVLFAVSGWACRCTDITVEEDFKTSDVVFSGKVLHRGELKDGQSADLLIGVKFDVVEFWKTEMESGSDDQGNSEKSRKIEVSTAAHTPSCGYPFKVGETYLVFADSSQVHTEGGNDADSNLLTTGWCSANQPLNDLLVTIALLGQLEALQSEFESNTDDEESEELEESHEPS